MDARVRKVLRSIRLHPDYCSRPDLDQCPATVETVLRRSRLLNRRSIDMLLLGDDDLLGVVLAMRKARKRILVLDMDMGLLDLLHRVGPTAMETAEHDLRKELPSGLLGSFDEVFTDPPYTLTGQLLFVHRGVCALRPASGTTLWVCASRVYMTVRELGVVRDFLMQAGFELTGRYPNFNRYKAPPDVRIDLKKKGRQRTAWFDSDLFRYERRRISVVPALPHLCNTTSIYDYTSASA